MANSDNYKAMSADFVSTYGVRRGTRVKVLRGFQSGELGYNNSPSDRTRGLVGNEAEVEGVTDQGSIRVGGPRGNRPSSLLPFFVLEVLAPAQQSVSLASIRETATVRPQGVTVGCTTFPAGTFTELRNRVVVAAPGAAGGAAPRVRVKVRPEVDGIKRKDISANSKETARAYVEKLLNDGRPLVAGKKRINTILDKWADQPEGAMFWRLASLAFRIDTSAAPATATPAGVRAVRTEGVNGYSFNVYSDGGVENQRKRITAAELTALAEAEAAVQTARS